MTLGAQHFVPDAEAAAELELAIIEHPQLNRAVEALAALQARSLVSRGNRRMKARGLMITGAAGAGKSTIVEYWQSQNPPTETKFGVVKPVVVVEVPEYTTRRALVNAIFEALGYSAEKMTAEDIISSIANKVKLLGVELIILDETHHILQGREISAVSEFLKSLLNRIGAGMVFVGLPGINEIARSSTQFDRRLMPDVVLAPYDLTNVPERVEFLILLSRLEAQLGLPEPSGLHDQDVARRIYAAARGEIGLVTKYLSHALFVARRTGLRKIDLNLLARVDALWHPTLKVSNVIGFNDDLDLDNQVSLEDLAANARQPHLDGDTNPFICDNSKLLKILQMRREHPEEYISPSKRTTGRRAPGIGRPEPKAFEK
ncbi:TniB family NTP-binding protein [Sphingobium yanoikuyae]|uniref:TniB family NTP-binding protein n=1 Tax=Sphingobium yanoikuyae TaxID=13690 RepID=UPI003F045C33